LFLKTFVILNDSEEFYVNDIKASALTLMNSAHTMPNTVPGYRRGVQEKSHPAFRKIFYLYIL